MLPPPLASLRVRPTQEATQPRAEVRRRRLVLLRAAHLQLDRRDLLHDVRHLRRVSGVSARLARSDARVHLEWRLADCSLFRECADRSTRRRGVVRREVSNGACGPQVVVPARGSFPRARPASLRRISEGGVASWLSNPARTVANFLRRATHATFHWYRRRLEFTLFHDYSFWSTVRSPNVPPKSR